MITMMGVVVHSCNPTTRELGMGDVLREGGSGIGFPTLTRRPLGINL